MFNLAPLKNTCHSKNKQLILSKMKKKLLWMFNLLILPASTFAQGIAIKGTISDAKTGETLPAVNKGLC
jgi:hypothetical protein